MSKPFDASFFIGTLVVVVAVIVAVAAVTTKSLPLIGSGRGALIAVAVIGMTGCAIAGISQAPILGWTHPVIILGALLGVVALAVIAAGLLGWDALLRPVAGFVPGTAEIAPTTEQVAVAALGALIVLKWAIGVVFAASRALT
jgi:hypothetical protein